MVSHFSISLNKLGTFKNGVNFTKEQMGSGYSLINVKDLFGDNPYINFSELDLVDLGNQRVNSSFTVEKNDLFFVRSSVKRDGVGLVRISKVKEINTVHCGFIIRFRLHDENVDPLYITYYLRSPVSRKRIINMSGGSALTNISQAALGSIPVDLPPNHIQRKIVSILLAYDDLIENNTRRIKILEEMAQTLYREWFVNFRYPGHESVPLVESELGMIPEGWEVLSLGDLVKDKRISKQPSYLDAGTAYIGLEHLPRKSIGLNNWTIADEVQSTKFVFAKNDILFGKIRPYFHKVGIAPIEGVCSTDIIVVVPQNEAFLNYSLMLMSSEIFIDHATATSQGTKMPRANWGVMKQYRIAFPNNSLLDLFNLQVSSYIQLIQILIIKNKNLRQQRDLLLPRLISGELDVEDLQIEVN